MHKVEGTIVAMEGPGSGTGHHKAWLRFKNLQDFSLVGNGRINGKGNRWWSQVCRPTMKVRYQGILGLLRNYHVQLSCPQCDGKCCSCFVVGFAMFSVNRQVEVTIVHFGAIFCPWSYKIFNGLGSLDSWICRTVAQELRSLPM